jgi:hypothetical protein
MRDFSGSGSSSGSLRMSHFSLTWDTCIVKILGKEEREEHADSDVQAKQAR